MKTDAQRWCKRINLTQSDLADILGRTQGTVSNMLRQEPLEGPYRAAISAWEIMTEQQREDWQRRIENSGQDAGTERPSAERKMPVDTPRSMV